MGRGFKRSEIKIIRYMGVAIKVENLSKAYQLGEIGTGTLSNDLKRWAYKVRGKEDPFLKIGETNDRTTKGESDMVWSLKDINFEIEQGDAVGIIGRNGAGKSTLLKILSRVTSPTTGSVKVKGRVASLLEVGTGFHPELTGRENIFLNGAILGMRKAEIKKHFDAIVDFAGVERYIDTPVKRYSSGMYVRLAFAVAAHLESEILVVDEVLAVGDAEFQKKCLGKMNDVSKGEGRTILFVSHNMLAIKSLCKNGIYLENGNLNANGEIETIVNKYISQSKLSSNKEINQTSNGLTIKNITASNNGIDGNFNIEQDLTLTIYVQSEIKISLININLFFNTPEGSLIFATCSKTEIFDIGTSIYTCTIPANTLNDNTYLIDIMAVMDKEKSILNIIEALTLEGIETKRIGSWLGKYPGLIRPLYYKWGKTRL
jgi:lipopolysaccharide transport system ATP-binding protein